MHEQKDIHKKTDMEAQKNTMVPSGAEYFDFIATKIEKIATATYLVTSYIADTEPLRIDMRQKALSLLDGVTELKRHTLYGNMSHKELVEQTLLSLKTLLTMAAQVGIVSTMNADIIASEIAKTYTYIRDMNPHIEEANPFGRKFFTTGPSVHANIPKQSDLAESAQHTSAHKRQTDYVKDNSDMSNQDKGRFAESAIKPRKKSRRDFILSVIAKKGEVTIKDISSVFKGCSEKTIQRELITLMDEGLVSKVGERRWSRYSLTHPL